MQQKSTTFLSKKVNYYTQGGGGKTIVLLHGFLENSTMWFDYAGRLGESYFVIAIDIPGQGESEILAEAHTTSLMADAVDQVLKTEKIKSAVFIGHSMGGYVALSFGERYSEKLKGIIMLNSTALADSEIKKADRDRAIKVLKKSPAVFINEAIPNLFADENKVKFKNEIEAIIQNALAGSIAGACCCLRGMKVREDKTHLLKEGKFPVHFISGAKDNVIPLEKVKEQTALNGKIRSIIFPDSGHMSFLEAREECFTAILDLLDKIKW